MEFDLARLKRETFLADAEFHDEIDSTNTRGAALCSRSELAMPHLILAELQTQGRGRGSNTWWSQVGGLTLSLVLSEKDVYLPFERWSLISLLAGLAVAETLAETAPDDAIRVKWPNDVYLGGKKICGILCEIPSNRPPRLVLGIGLNVNNSLLAAPIELRERATSLTDLTGLLHDRQEILSRLLYHLATFLRDPQSLAPDALPAVWERRCLLTGRDVTVECAGVEQSGRCLGIDADGALLLETPPGIQRQIGGTVTRWRK